MITPIRALTIQQICERKNDLLMSDDDIKEMARNVRNKAIDEFASELENHSIYADTGKRDEVKMEWVSPVTRIKKMAEQMKEGAI